MGALIAARVALRRHRKGLDAVADDQVVKRTLEARIACGEMIGWRDQVRAGAGSRYACSGVDRAFYHHLPKP